MRTETKDEARGRAAARSGELVTIQYLRAFAALAVVAFHAAERAGLHFATGAAGVDVFFVISGFIMSLVGARPDQTPLGFLQRRVERVAPLYWFVTLAVAGLALAAPSLFPRMVVTASHVVQSMLFIPHVSPTGEPAPLIVPGWTLNYEAFFYILFALTLLAPPARRIWFLSAALGALVFAGLVFEGGSLVWRTYTNPLLLEFLAGAWLGQAWKRGWTIGRAGGGALIVAGLIGYAGVAVAGIDVDPVRIFAWGLPAFLIVAGAASIEQSAPPAKWRPLSLLGDASYSIYLVHGLAISAAARLLPVLGLSSQAVILIGGFLAAAAVGVASYFILEKPTLAFFRVRQKRAGAQARNRALA
jgi:exopolysaccharide production protein ExoZ